MKGLLKRAHALILPTLLVAAMILPTAALTTVHNASEEYRQSPYYRHLRDLELTGDQRTDVVLVALSQLGYHEGDSEADMHGLNTKGSKNFV